MDRNEFMNEIEKIYNDVKNEEELMALIGIKNDFWND